MKLGIPFAKTVTHQIFVIYLDQAKLEASGWCVVVHWTNNESCFFTKILSMGKTHTPNITYDIDSKSWQDCVLDVKCRSLWCIYEWYPNRWSTFLMRWVIAINIVRKLFSRRNPSPLLKGLEISHWDRFYGLDYSQSLAKSFWYEIPKYNVHIISLSRVRE
jgi:hypothetical protein